MDPKFVSLAMFTAEEVLSQKKKTHTCEINGISHTVDLTHKKYRVFRENRKCVICGIEGKWFFLHYYNNRNFLSFFSSNLTLMTIDHITPRSRGGTDALSNHQTMCGPCNEFKGNRIISNEELKQELGIDHGSNPCN